MSYVLLTTASENGFGYILPNNMFTSEQSPAVFALPENSHVLNVILHTMYSMPANAFGPSVGTLRAAVTGLVKYGVPLQIFVARGTPLYNLFIAIAPQAPVDIYALAGRYNLYDLAAETSPLLLAHKMEDITPEQAEQMGPIYLNRLIGLQSRRVEVLKYVLKAPPRRHPETESCKAGDQDRLLRAWELTAAYFVWEQRPGTCRIRME